MNTSAALEINEATLVRGGRQADLISSGTGAVTQGFSPLIQKAVVNEFWGSPCLSFLKSCHIPTQQLSKRR